MFFLIREMNVGIFLLIRCRKADTNKYVWKIVFWHFVDKDISRFKNLVDQDFYLKIARPDSSQNFMNTAKTIDLTRLCIQSHTRQT